MYLDFTINQANNHALKKLEDTRGISLMGVMTDEYVTTSENRAAFIDLYSILNSLPQVAGGTQGVQGIKGSQGILGIQGAQGIQGNKGNDAILDTENINKIIETVYNRVTSSLDLYSIVPIGTILAYAGEVAPKTDKYEYKICDGSELDSNLYSELYSILGTKFGEIAEKVKLPNLIGKSIKGSESDLIGNTGGKNDILLATTNVSTGFQADNEFMNLNYIIRVK